MTSRDFTARLPDSPAAVIAVGYLVGVIAARLIGLVGPVPVGPFAVTLSAAALPVLFWTATKLAVRPRAPGRDRTRLALAVAAGVVGDELVYLALRQAGVGYWDPLSLAGTVAMTVGALGLVAALSAVADGDADDEQPPTPDRWLPVASGAAVALSFVGYRASQHYLKSRGVPNEERSMVLWGYEIHHVSTGSVLLVLGAVALASPGLRRRWHRLAALAAAVGCGFVADEVPYVFYPTMTDALYFGLPSTVGAAVVTGALVAAIAYHTHHQEARNHG
jgi:hypothetical protein